MIMEHSTKINLEPIIRKIFYGVPHHKRINYSVIGLNKNLCLNNMKSVQRYIRLAKIDDKF